jgi:hypothetical protein
MGQKRREWFETPVRKNETKRIMKMKYSACLMSLITLGSLSASAQTTTFGSLPGATFGGSGIPNDAVEVTTITDGSDIITLGLTATQRYPASPIVDNGDLVNNSAGTYYAPTGEEWNFDYYASVSGPDALTDFNIVLDYNLVPGTPQGSWDLSVSYTGTPTFQDSQYPGSSFLASSAYEPTIEPPSGSYNVNSVGDYDFDLSAYSGSSLLGTDAITVVAANAPDATSTLPLLGAGFAALAGLRRRFNRA